MARTSHTHTHARTNHVQTKEDSFKRFPKQRRPKKLKDIQHKPAAVNCSDDVSMCSCVQEVRGVGVRFLQKA